MKKLYPTKLILISSTYLPVAKLNTNDVLAFLKNWLTDEQQCIKEDLGQVGGLLDEFLTCITCKYLKVDSRTHFWDYRIYRHLIAVHSINNDCHNNLQFEKDGTSVKNFDWVTERIKVHETCTNALRAKWNE